MVERAERKDASMQTIKRWYRFLSVVIILGLLLALVACNQEPGAVATEPAQGAPEATSQVSMPAVSSASGPGGGQEPAPQPGLSPTQGQSGVPAVGPAIPAGAVQPVEVATADGVTLAGTFYAPPAPNSPGLVMLHMVERQRGDWDTLARSLQAEGYGVLAIDLRGHGGSNGSREWTKMVADAAGAYAWLANRPEVDPTRIGLVGASIGANLALNFAAADPGVKTLVLLSPGLNYRGVSTPDAMTAYGQRPVLLVASTEDREAAVAVERLQQLAQGQQSVLSLQNQGHGTAMLGRENGLEDAILKWLQETL